MIYISHITSSWQYGIVHSLGQQLADKQPEDEEQHFLLPNVRFLYGFYMELVLFLVLVLLVLVLLVLVLLVLLP
jgi:hypothetical protein